MWYTYALNQSKTVLHISTNYKEDGMDEGIVYTIISRIQALNVKPDLNF